jgi:hypothetical protein
MTARTTSLAFLCAALFAACDQGADPGPGDDFRDGTSCLKTGTTISTTLKVGGVPDPEGPYDAEYLVKFIAPEQSVETVMSFSRAHPKHDAICKNVCAIGKMDWTGDDCVAGGEFTVGEYGEYETSDGDPRYSIPVTISKALPGCSCI